MTEAIAFLMRYCEYSFFWCVRLRHTAPESGILAVVPSGSLLPVWTKDQGRRTKDEGPRPEPVGPSSFVLRRTGQGAQLVGHLSQVSPFVRRGCDDAMAVLPRLLASSRNGLGRDNRSTSDVAALTPLRDVPAGRLYSRRTVTQMLAQRGLISLGEPWFSTRPPLACVIMELVPDISAREHYD
jgi:hypothetical protein